MVDTDVQELTKWRSVFGHLGTPDEVGNEWIRMSDQLERTKKTVDHLVDVIDDKTGQIRKLRAAKFANFNNAECWIYQGKDDRLESLVCPVVISPKVLSVLEECANVLIQYDGSRATDIYDHDLMPSYEWTTSRRGVLANLRKLKKEA